MESARENAIVALRRLIGGVADDGLRLVDDREIEAAVDAIIEAARAPESAHSRAVAADIRRESDERRR